MARFKNLALVGLVWHCHGRRDWRLSGHAEPMTVLRNLALAPLDQRLSWHSELKLPVVRNLALVGLVWHSHGRRDCTLSWHPTLSVAVLRNLASVGLGWMG